MPAPPRAYGGGGASGPGPAGLVVYYIFVACLCS